jgi:ABC-type sulfate/molybdate transport systems ATPase subunit
LAVNDDIYKIIKEEGKTAIIVTHDIAEAISMSERLYVLSKRPGSIKLSLDIKLYDNSTAALIIVLYSFLTIAKPITKLNRYCAMAAIRAPIAITIHVTGLVSSVVMQLLQIRLLLVLLHNILWYDIT